MCVWKPNALFERAVVHAKARGRSAREGKETIRQEPSGQRGLTNPSWLLTAKPHAWLGELVEQRPSAVPIPSIPSIGAGNWARRTMLLCTSTLDGCWRNRLIPPEKLLVDVSILSHPLGWFYLQTD